MGASNRRLFSRLVHSFTLKLVLLALVLLSIPQILYWQFAQAEQEQLALMGNAVVQTNHVLAAMLRSHFERFAHAPSNEMREALGRAAVGSTRIKILVRLKNSDNFLYVASVPSVPQKYLDAERAELIRSGIFHRLGPSCDGSTNLDRRFVNPAGKEEVLAAMTPVHVNGDCWIVITSENASSLARTPIGLPFWRAPTVWVAGSIYLVSTALVIWLFIHMWRNVRRFRDVARHIRLRDTEPVSFQKNNTIPELTGVAEDFDSLVEALTSSQRRMKEAAEENSHALKAPLAVIAQSVEPIKRAVPPENAAARRSILLIERSVAKLDAMVSAHRDLEDAGADLIYPERQPMDLSRFLWGMLPTYEAMLAEQGKRLIVSVAPRVMAYANEDVMEPVIENLLENAASFTPEGGAIEIRLHVEGDKACLRVLDQGPGVLPGHLPRIFERAVSFRDETPGDTMTELAPSLGHQGLGL
ncbi:MAG TPA: HAMP domain-containing sensor histidine kinase, partial [Bryobacteraceae bacterium]|nr:HAMP domain-containing sensor histidine kinase [Bryobacteraceae bacterium]